MIISSVQVENFKSFRSSPKVQFGPGFNVIVGPNNAGKSALLESMVSSRQDKPHRTSKTIPIPGTGSSGWSRFNLIFDIPKPEFYRLARQKSPSILFSVDASRDANRALAMLEGIVKRGPSVETKWVANGLLEARFDADVRDIPRQGSIKAAQVAIDPTQDSMILESPNVVGTEYDRTAASWLAKILQSRVYCFRAERLNLQTASIEADSILRADASNLPSVLHFLQSQNPARYARLNSLLSTVFPDIRQVTVPPVERTGTAMIQVWGIDAATERSDLAVPLGECGTGIGQVLAMLYVVVTSDDPMVLLIDEPQSFLHPGATRKLLEILRDFPQHQYILTTHSPTVVACAEPTTCHLVTKEDNESTVVSVDPGDASTARVLLSTVGARLSDVFGADNVLWVEGKTEELCFPDILREVGKCPLRGTQIMGIVNTGDLATKKRKTMLEVYNRLSRGTALLPPAVGFIMDREDLSENDRDELAKQSDGRMHFLPRRMYENYLVDSDALAAVIGNVADFRAEPVTAAEVAKWIEENGSDSSYFKPLDCPKSQEGEIWKRDVHGGRLLSTLFSELSGNRYTYDKVEHGFELTRWIIGNKPELLKEIADLMVSILGDRA